MDENKEVISTDPKREKVRVIPLSAIDDAPDHPFGVRDDEEMAELVESISTFGVINPVIVIKGEGERYELISGHRRKYEIMKEEGLATEEELESCKKLFRLYNIEYINDMVIALLELIYRVLQIIAYVQNSSSSSSKQ